VLKCHGDSPKEARHCCESLLDIPPVPSRGALLPTNCSRRGFDRGPDMTMMLTIVGLMVDAIAERS
jgi:hypothetical protein